MKYFAYAIITISIGFSIFNATKINLDAPFKDESMIAFITILASLCAILLMSILLISKRIEEKTKNNKKHA